MGIHSIITAGLDAGMDRTKALILKDGEKPIWNILPGGTDSAAEVARKALNALADKAGIGLSDIQHITATGTGRSYITFADLEAPEFQCLAKGIHEVLPSTRILLDLGARKSLAVKCAAGRTLKVASSSKCASGTGTYLEMVSSILGIDVDEMTPLALQSDKDVTIQSTCAVFAESEIISLVHDGHKPEDIVWGVFRGMSGRIYPQLLELGLEQDIAVVGGVARSKAMISALEAMVGFALKVPENPEIVGALGAALLGRDAVQGK
jgi:predicted CoA-substrate-specific enzyme activase